MDEADINRYLKNALDQVNAQHEEHLKEQHKELRLEEKLTKKFNDHLGCTHIAAPYFLQVMGPQPTAELVSNPVNDVINICCVAW